MSVQGAVEKGLVLVIDQFAVICVIGGQIEIRPTCGYQNSAGFDVQQYHRAAAHPARPALGTSAFAVPVWLCQAHLGGAAT